METYDLSKITAQDFEEYLGGRLDIVFSQGQTVPAAVQQVINLESYSPLDRAPFSVVFQTQSDQPCRTQGIYQLNHPGSGLIEVFLVPIGRDQNGYKYEAVFS